MGTLVVVSNHDNVVVTIGDRLSETNTREIQDGVITTDNVITNDQASSSQDDATGITRGDKFCNFYFFRKTGKYQCSKRKKVGDDYCSKHGNRKYVRPDECPICYECFETENKPLSCGHWVHSLCMIKWKEECPICRQHIPFNKTQKKIANKLQQQGKLTEILETLLLLLPLIISRDITVVE